MFRVECGQPSTLGTPYGESKTFSMPNEAQNFAKAWLRKGRKYCSKFDHVGLAKLNQAIDEINAIPFERWQKATVEHPLYWEIDVGWTHLAVRMVRT